MKPVKKILQFGEGVFLRGFWEPMIDRMNRESSFGAEVYAVKPRPGKIKEDFLRRECRYHLLIRGVDHDGKTVEKLEAVQCLKALYSSSEQWDRIEQLAVDPALQILVSNTTEAGIVYAENDWSTFPGKVAKLLQLRAAADLPGVAVFPCELIEKNGDRTYVSLSEDAAKLKDCQHEHILTEFDVDDVCKMIIAGETSERQQLMGGQGFVEFVNEKAAWYCNHQRHYCELTTACFRCPFYKTSESRPEDKDGFEECWMEKAKFCPEDFQRPLIEELWGGGNARLRGNLLRQGKYFLDAITADDIGTPSNPPNRPGLDHCQRKIVQIGMTTGRQEMLGELCGSIRPDGAYLDVDGLRNEMANWRFPLHMIDFETTSVALPFFAGMRPYEQVAFQFSHHIIEKDDSGYRIRHAGQYINTEQGKFPNFEFVRELKKELGSDEGTVFRYATHENTILNAIRRQLIESNEPDKDELITFIEGITHCNDERRPGGNRDMVDLCDIVKRFFYHPSMKGSNSIKAVLPAILNVSSFLQEKYSQPIYGKEIASKNISEVSPVAWISKTADGKIENPYKKLPNVAEYLPEGLLADVNDGEATGTEMSINNGGAALTAYSMLQFCGKKMVEPLKQALLRYCELDTLAMVFIWEYFATQTK